MPPDPFAGDPDDPARTLRDEETDPATGVTEHDRAELLEDLSDLSDYQGLLEPRGVRGIVVDCGDCNEPHYHDWALLRASLEQLLEMGEMRPHEPAFEPDPANYVTWDYCRGYADAIHSPSQSRG